ncbi:kinase-like domain-containing protein [Staphylotrichum tortipilum]|uniref:Kinase-like domain-containing protein n=1 Tax=Staphylotrichum tortipilum TaxID=2831512 RepID=A0AAN6MVQ8_9PEZI|nr:kinase-like domain-containing protein [Staphylotrichum longicolle]
MSSSSSLMREIRDDDSKFYVTRRELGEGSYGKIFEMQRRGDGKLMACKFQQVASSYQDWATGRELKVWRTACTGTNYVVRVYDAAYNPLTHEVRIYTEVLEGGDLHKLLNRIYTSQTERRIHPLIVYHAALQLAWGLAEIQARTILHRDIKTDNVLMTMKITSEMNQGPLPEVIRYCNGLYQRDDRLCVLTDFGLGRNETDQERSTYTMAPGARWMRGGPPECSVYGPVPPTAGNPFPRVSTLYSSSLQQIVDECLSWDPLLRPTAGSMVQRLWALKTAECARMNLRFGQQKQYKHYLAEYEQKRQRREEIERRARERDEQAAERQRAIAAWNAHLAQQRAAEAAQVPARGKLTREQRAEYIAQSNRRMVQQGYLNAQCQYEEQCVRQRQEIEHRRAAAAQRRPTGQESSVYAYWPAPPAP